jgi:hypothetical protein
LQVGRAKSAPKKQPQHSKKAPEKALEAAATAGKKDESQIKVKRAKNAYIFFIAEKRAMVKGKAALQTVALYNADR